MSEHTPEPWQIDEDGHRIEANPTGNDGGMRQIAACYSTWADANANARRIVACVNACAGISTEGLERGSPIISANQLLIARCDELERKDAAVAELNALILEKVNLNSQLADYLGDAELAIAELLAMLKYVRTNGIFGTFVVGELDAAIAKAEK